MDHILNLGTEQDPQHFPLHTRRRTYVPNVQRPEKSPEQMQGAVEIVTQGYPRATCLSASGFANCYGLVFASRRTCPIDESCVEIFRREDGFYDLPFHPEWWKPGDVVLYQTDSTDPSHVATVAYLDPPQADGVPEVWVVSSWGESGEYLHPIDPGHVLLGKPYKVVTQRLPNVTP